MYIKEIKLKNFKSFKELSFDCNDKFNVIIGENNIGKSTIFEAILIWESCFKRIINSKRTGFYKADGGNTYIPFGDLSFIRLINDTDLFFESPNKSRITIVISSQNNEFALTFELSKPISISNSYLRFKTINHREFEKFSIHLKERQIKLDDALFIYQTKPVSNILSQEPFMNKGQVLKKISIGKSGETIRNKIVAKKKQNRKRLEEQISNVLGIPVTFNCLNETRAHVDEHINLKVQHNQRKLDIHLQGSGFLQIAEIFSTIDYLENAINILIIDEPDSHIHAKLQKQLLKELRKIEKTQTFIISHNDNFVSELSPSELYYLNQESKEKGKINKLPAENFDHIKKEMGGIIVALDKLNYTDKICFVEGEDDIHYLKKLLEKYLQIFPNKETNNEVVFYYLRGKDNILQKLDHNKRLLSQLFRDKSFAVIYDKDFCTENANEEFKNSIHNKLGNQSSVFSHQGYCIESTLFSSKDLLTTFISKFHNIEITRVYFFIEEFMAQIRADFALHSSEYYKEFQIKFNGQKKESRPELNSVDYNAFLQNALEEHNQKLEYLFNKKLISDFVRKLETHFEKSYYSDLDGSDEYYSSSLFSNYIKWINSENDFFDSNKVILESIYDIS